MHYLTPAPLKTPGPQVFGYPFTVRCSMFSVPIPCLSPNDSVKTVPTAIIGTKPVPSLHDSAGDPASSGGGPPVSRRSAAGTCISRNIVTEYARQSGAFDSIFHFPITIPNLPHANSRNEGAIVIFSHPSLVTRATSSRRIPPHSG